MALRKSSRAASLAFRESFVRVRAWTESPVLAEMVRPASGSAGAAPAAWAIAFSSFAPSAKETNALYWALSSWMGMADSFSDE